MSFGLFPKEEKFFDLFDKQAAGIIKASNFFKEIVENGTFDDIIVLKMHDIEHECDTNTHDIIELLNRTFITPFDREDIHELAQELDNIVDMLYSITNRLKIYKIKEINSDLILFTEYIGQSVFALSKALHSLRKLKDTRPIMENNIEVHKLENLGDQLKDALVGKLIDSNPDPIFFIKWKEIFEGAETVLDICEDVANVIESILVKQG